MGYNEIILTIWFILVLPFIAFYKALINKMNIPNDGMHVFAGVIWPIALALTIIGQLLYVLIVYIIKIYEWLYKFFEGHI